MKKIASLVFFLALGCFAFSQDLSKFHLYIPTANAEKDIADVVKKAKAERKNVFVQIGGNWCIWCARFNNFITDDSKIDSLVKSDFIVYHLNYSKENENLPLMRKYQYPQRFGFPVFLVIDGNGKLLHTQDSSLLEENKSYNAEKVFSFLYNWSSVTIKKAAESKD